MLSAVAQSLRIGLAPNCAALISKSHWKGGRVTVLAESTFSRNADPEEIGRQFGLLLEGAVVRSQPANLIVSDELVRMWAVSPPAGAACMADLEAAATMRFHALFGEPHLDWKISADWNARTSFLAVAMPTSLLEQLQRNAGVHRIRLVEIVPQFVAALNGSRTRRGGGAWFAFVDADVLTTSMFDGEKLIAVRTARLPAGADREWLDTFLEREALRLGLVLPALLQLSGQVPMAWQSEKGRLEFECATLDGAGDVMTAAVRLACTGITR